METGLKLSAAPLKRDLRPIEKTDRFCRINVPPTPLNDIFDNIA